MVGLDPIVHWKMGYGARMVNVLLGGPPEVILGLAILSQRTPIASMYTLASTHAGGALLWVSTEAATIGGFLPIFWQWMRSDERAAAREDARAANRVALASTPPSPVSTEEPGSSDAGPVRNAPTGLSVWEANWLARTGKVPLTSANARPANGSERPVAPERQD
jgi:hypothetical protein